MSGPGLVQPDCTLWLDAGRLWPLHFLLLLLVISGVFMQMGRNFLRVQIFIYILQIQQTVPLDSVVATHENYNLSILFSYLQY